MDLKDAEDELAKLWWETPGTVGHAMGNIIRSVLATDASVAEWRAALVMPAVPLPEKFPYSITVCGSVNGWDYEFKCVTRAEYDRAMAEIAAKEEERAP